MDTRLQPVADLLATMIEITEDPEREAFFAVESIDFHDPATMIWAAACLVAFAATLENATA